MKQICHAGLLFLCWVFLTAMGGLGDCRTIRAPMPPINFAATIADRSNLSTMVEQFSMEGKTAISGRLGSGRVSIDFAKIASIDFVFQGESLKAEVALKEGNKVCVVVDRGMACYGKLPYGDIQIAVEEIRAITIHGPATQKNIDDN